jgi:Mrp family chromosome partitioning ATPase
MGRDKGWDIAIAVARGGRPVVAGSAVPGMTPDVAESLRSLWSQVFPVTNPSRGYCVLVTAAEEGEGVSQIATGLALAGVEAGPDRRIAIVDFNLYRPGIAGLFRLPAMPGVVDALAGELPIEQVPVQTQNAAIDVLPAGRLNGHAVAPFPARAAGELLERLREDYDFVVLDAPAVNHGDIAASLAPLVDGVLLVVRAGETPREAVIEARLRLERAGARIAGVVLNG